ncbi:MAG TPA: hypothetical protein VFT63_06580 [bacterium]|nr:hypothetical protein [bacterium]
MRQREAFSLGQEFAEVLVIDPSVRRPSEMHDPLPDGVTHAPRRATATVSMDEGFGAMPAICAAQAPDLTGGESQEVGRFSHEKLGAIQGIEDDELLLCTARQGDHASLYSARKGRTFSLKS